MKKITKHIIRTCAGVALSLNLFSQDLDLPYGSAQHTSLPERTFNFAQAKSSSLTVPDTLWYFLNKHFYRNPSPINFFFNFYEAPANPAPAALSHGGSVFLNPGTLQVTGLEAVLQRKNTSVSANVPVKLYLCNVNANNLPVFPPVDSVLTGISGFGFATGNFVTPRTMTANFAVLVKNESAVTGDTIQFQLTNAQTFTSASTNANAKYGEGLGVVRIGGSFIKTTNAFGGGSDFEFLVAARVNYSTSISIISPTLSVCTKTAYTYSNTSTPYLNHRQYNLNKFYAVWKPFGNTQATASIAADSVYTWNFGAGAGNIYNQGLTQSQTYTAAGVFTPSLTVKFQKMSGYLNFSPSQVKNKITDVSSFSLTAKNCNTVSTVGISSIDGSESLQVYPNPVIWNEVMIKGLSGTTDLLLFNMMGQVVLSEKTDKESISLNLKTLPAGTYILKVLDQNSEIKVKKLIKE